MAVHDFAVLLDSSKPIDDAALAELIESDGRLRLERGEPVDLNRYLAAVPDLRQRQDPLDTAIDVTLRAMSGSSCITPEAVEQLTQRCPDLELTIREVAVLNKMVWTTTDLRPPPQPLPPPKQLPCDFGPIMNSPAGDLHSIPQRRYELQKLLGQGGFGQVYLARDRQLSEEIPGGHTAMVAIKILATGDISAASRQRLVAEATKVRRINHPNVVVVIDRGVTEQNEDYIVYEYIDGGSLISFIDRKRLIPVREAAALMVKVAKGVHAAHSAGVIHCDVKPSNIMLTAAGEPKVADFGIAVRSGPQFQKIDRASRHPFSESVGPDHNSTVTVAEHPNSDSQRSWDASNRPIGSLAFVSPEQYRLKDDGLSIPSDVYSMGGVFFVLLTGELPNGSSPEQIAANHDPVSGRKEAPYIRTKRPEVDARLEAICRRAMAVNVTDRYNSAATFAEDLERWLRHEPIAWMRPGIPHVLGLWTRRKPALAAALVLICIVFIAGLVVALRLNALANRNAVDAAVSQLTADWEQESRLQRTALAEKFIKSLKETLGNYRLSTEALPKIWALEYVYGPNVLGLPDQQAELWKNRIVNIRNLVQTAQSEGRSDEFETMLWESALGFWLVCDKDFAEAQPLLESNLAKWSRILPPTDPWLVDLRSMMLCASVNRLAKATSTPDKVELRQIEASLATAADALPVTHRGTPIHCLLLGTLIDLYGPNLLNEPVQASETTAALKALIANKPPANR